MLPPPEHLTTLDKPAMRDPESWRPTHELIGPARPRAQPRPHRTVPSDLATLADVHPGQVVEVRSILSGAGQTAALLRTGDVLICRGRTVEWLVVEQPGHGELAVHRHDAGLVQIEWHDRDGLG
jgi:hypothetical protein